MEFRILGPLEAVDARGPVALGGRRHRMLLTTLALYANETVSADRLVEALWGEREPASARQMLHVQVSELRKVLFADAPAAGEIVARRPGYQLRVDRDAVDVQRFERLAAAGRQALDRDDAEGAAAPLRAALDLWRGPPLADLAERPFARAEIARLEGLRLQAHEAWVDAELARGRHHDVVGELQRLAAEHPLREGLRARLMLALYRAARQGDALEVYREGERYLREELGLDPGVELRDLRDAILRQDPSLLPAAPVATGPPPPVREPAGHNLPVQFTSFVGREHELAELDALLAARRLVTLSGVGGVGKSRLALEAAAAQLAERPDGVWLVELGAVLEPELLDSTLAQVLRVPEHPQHPLRRMVVERLRGADALLIIDNCEHLVATVSRLVRDLLQACPTLRVLCTSRERLGITGEVVRTVTGLALPPPDDRGATVDSDAVRLFVERSSAVHGHWRHDDPQRAAVADVCRHLDGLPLAIELAAARTTTLHPAQIADRLDRRFGLLTGGSRDALTQHRTLRAVVDWSYELLEPDEQRFFDRLAVFVGGFTLEAADLVCAGDEPDGSAALLAQLVDKSLVAADSFDLPEYRYRLLETLREYGQERLTGRDDAVRVRHRHAAYFLFLAQSAAAGLRTGEHRAWLQRLDAEHGNLRAALDHTLASGDGASAAVLAGSLYPFWDLHGHYAEGRRWLTQVRGQVEGVSATVRSRVLMGIATLAVIQGDLDDAVEACEEACAVSRGVDDTAGLAHALQYLGLIAVYTAELDRAQGLLETSVATAVAGGAAWEEGWALFFLCLVALARSDFAEADRLAVRAEHVLRPVGDQEGLSWVLCVRGVARWGTGDDAAAARTLAAGARSFHDLGALWGTSIALLFSGLLLARRPAAAGLAVRTIAAAEALRESGGIGTMWFTEDWHREAVATLSGRLGAEAFRHEWATGRQTGAATAVEAAVAALAP